jgi:hypothetical protein
MNEEENVETIPQNEQELETQEVEAQEAETQEIPETPQAFRVKHLHEEKEISYDEAPTYIQKGLDYDRVKSKYEESKPVLSFIERLAKQNDMSVDEYVKAVEEHERQQEIEELQSQRNLDPELAEELYLLRQERANKAKLEEQQKQQEQKQKEYLDFLDEFKDVEPDKIPQEVFDIKVKNGISLTDAYIRYQYKNMLNKETIDKVNQENAATSTGSLTGNGANNVDTLTMEKVATMSERELSKRWPEVKKLYGMK